MDSNIVLKAQAIEKYFTDPEPFKVLDNVSFEILKGEFTSIVGKSGCGKSTLLYILSTMDTDYSGQLWIGGEDMKIKSEKELAAVRNEHIGFVFQFHYLLNEFSVLKNVILPGLKLQKLSPKDLEEKAMLHLKQLGIDSLAPKMAYKLSGGEKQRVAIARALINDPLIIMGDEPTGNLDHKNSEIVFDIFEQLSKEYGQSLLIVTHDDEFAARTGKTIIMEDGRIVQKN
ncbi:MAG: ABC transporter ATP-binding protein [Saprospiraceae bacterium]|nr:ABC transporter ATP-binding protein [Saprospiraceae bacterium]MBK8668403.1 ABC transporter ATP-binding protein [Saprospiraceae bacterium]